MEKNKKPRLCVIGGGPGGYPAAFFAADRGFEVTLVDKEAAPGGVCLYRGCIPSKSLLHAARILDEAREAAGLGLVFAAPEIDLEQLRAFSRGVVSRLTGGLGALARGRRIRFLQGSARLESPHAVAVARPQGGEERVEADFILIATGSEPSRVPGLPADSARILDSTGALALPDVPGKLLVVGGGYIGLELGTVYAALGSRVTVVEASPRLLQGADEDLVAELRPRLEARLEALQLSTRVTEAAVEGERVRVRLLGLDRDPGENLFFDRVLVAVGRKPVTQGLGLEATRVERDGRGFLVTDRQRRTAEPSIFAVGDVAGEPMLAHKATYEARIAVEAMAGSPSAFDPAAIPAVVFTDPELAWCGLTEEQARARSIPHKTTRFPWAASGRAATLGRSEGLTKLLLDPATERVLGVGICGSGAGELIAEGVLAVEMGALARDLQLAIHAHPTLSETMMEAAELFHGPSAHFLDRK